MEALPLDRVLPLLEHGELPCFIYDTTILVANIKSVRARFPRYHYPVKCNALPAMVHAAIGAGAELDLCSRGDLEIAHRLGALSDATSFTGVGMTTALMRDVAAAGCRVNLNSADEAEAWVELGARRVPGVRIEIAARHSGYGSKFGVRAADVAEVCDVRRGRRIAGLHVHDSHRDRSPAEAARVLASALEAVPSWIIAGLEYVCLGGGWPHAYEGEAPWDIDDVAAAFEVEVEGPLRVRGFSGHVLVEPGEFVAAPAGVWLARIASVKRARASASGECIIILDTPTPVPCAEFRYPMTLVRDGGFMTSDAAVVCSIFGSSNSGRDCIRRNVSLPEPAPGDILAIGDTGAYVRSLISSFNERTVPVAYSLPVETMRAG